MTKHAITPINAEDFLQGGGLMGRRMRSLDWSATTLGPPASWPQSLKTVIRIVLSSRYAMWMFWGDDLTFFCNDAYLPTLGVKQDWALGSRSDKVWEEIWPEVGPRIDSVLRTSVATYDENLMLFLERSGYVEETYHTFSYSPLADDDGVVVGMLCVVTEETEKVIGQRRLALLGDLAARLGSSLSEYEVFSTFGEVVQSQPDLPFVVAYISHDGSGSASVALDGAGGGPDLAAQLRMLISERDAENLGIRIVALPETLRLSLPVAPWDKPASHAAIVHFTEGGRGDPAGYLLVGINPYRPADEAYGRFLDLLAGQLGSILTNARARESERRRAESLAELDRAKTLFFSNVSHEFRTPLTLMLGPIEDALSDAASHLEPLQRGRLDIAHRNALRLLKLVNSLLDFSRIEAGRVQAAFEAVDLALFTADLAANFRAATERAGLTLKVDCEPLSELVYIDREMWEKIVLNLLSNAFKFTFKGEIAISLARVGSMAELVVRDTGVGIPAKDLPRLFERFHRIEGQQSRSHEGSGIGLALVYELVHLHGGSIRAQSEVGRGSAFIVTIPLGDAHIPAERLSAGGAVAPTSGRAGVYLQEALRWLPEQSELESALSDEVAPDPAIAGVRAFPPGQILLADDNADMRGYVSRLLGAHWHIRTASNGLEALAHIRNQRPDLVISDVMMPELDGFGLLRAIRDDEILRDMPVILLSARAGEESKVEGFSAGATDYLVKPFSARELIGRVAANLEAARLRQEATKALQQRTDQFETLLNAAPIGVYLIDGDFCIRQVNPVALPVFGNIKNLIGRNLDDVLHILWPKSFADEVVAHFRHTLETGESYVTPERFAHRRDTGQTEYYEWRIDRIVMPDGRFGVVCYFRDIAAEVAARRRQKLLIDELNHRVKNTLATVQSLALQTLRGASTAHEGRTRLDARLIALSKAHDVLTREHWEGADFSDVLTASLSPYISAGLEGRFLITGPAMRLLPKAALALSMALHELSTNAVKYGALSNEAGRVTIAWHIEERSMPYLVFRWIETGGPAVLPPARRGFGSRLVEGGLSHDLAGQAQLTFAPEGVTWHLEAPLHEIVNAD